MPNVIDGYCNENDIANSFKGVCIPNSKDKHEQQCSVFNELFMHYKGTSVSSDFTNVVLVQNVLRI